MSERWMGYSVEGIVEMAKYVVKLKKRIRELEYKQKKIVEWINAYPLEAFPEPDLKAVHKILENAGMSLGAVSAHAMRHVLNGIKRIIEDPIDE